MIQITYTFGNTQIRISAKDSRHQWRLYNDYVEKEEKAFREGEVYTQLTKEWEEGEIILQELKKEINKHKYVKDLFFGGSRCLCGARYYRACPIVDELWRKTKDLLRKQRYLQNRITFHPILLKSSYLTK